MVDRALVGWLGLGAVAVPLGLAAAAATIGSWGSPSPRRALWILAFALVVLLPLGGYLVGGGETVTGYVGEVVGEPLRRTTGWLGAWLVLLGGVVATSVGAFRFNPLAALAKGVGAVSRGVARGARRTRAAAKVRSARRADRSREVRTEREVRAEGETRVATDAGGERQARTERPARTETVAGGEREARAEMDAGVERQARADMDAVAERAARAENEAARPGGGVEPDDDSRPAFALLTAAASENRFGMEQELDRLGGVLVHTLGTFKIECRIVGRTTGPAVTQYEVVPAAGVKVNRIANLDADLALAMKAKSVRIVAPIPGKGAVGVEIPNPSPEIVRLREILEAPAFSHSRDALPLAMGKDLTGGAYVTDLAKMPHALIAGATGSGKSVCLNTIITSLVYRHGPDRLRLLLIDPKMVELSAYADLPHLRHSVVTDPKDAAGVLKWAVLEMERRYALLSANGVRSLKEFNSRVERDVDLRLAEPDGPEDDVDRWRYKDGVLPWIVVVVDELADLMMTVQAEVEKPLTQLAQKARAIGIHLLVATQRPSVNVITGLIKANFPCRIAFRVASKIDSRTILDQNGADSLLGSGDMLFLPPGRSEPVRMQGAFISTEETEALMAWYRAQADTVEALKARVKSTEGDILEELKKLESEGDADDKSKAWGDWDDLFRDAAAACIQQGAGSTSLLQRRLRIGYGRAARIVDQLHDAGVLGPPDGSKPREVLVDHQGLDEICPS